MPDVKLRFEITDGGTVRVIEDVAEKTKKVGDEAEKSSTRASAAFDKLKIAAAATAAAVGAAATATAYAVNRQFQQIDELAKLSRSIGISVEQLSGLQVTADLAGVSLQELGQGVAFFSRKITEAQQGMGKSGDIFRTLGVDIASGRQTIDVLYDVADAFEVLQDGTQKTALAQELFSRSGTRFISLLNAGGEAIRGQMEEARILGQVISGETAVAVENFNDDMTRIRLLTTGFQRDLAVALAPTLEVIADTTVNWAIANRQLAASGLANFASGTASAFSDLISYVPGISALTEKLKEFALLISVFGGAPPESLDLGDRVIGDPSKLSQRFDDAIKRQKDLEAALASLGNQAAKTGAQLSGRSSGNGYASGTVWTPFVDGVEQFQGAIDLTLAQAELVPGAINDWTDSIEQAQVAAVNLGDILSDSLVSAVDGLITRGDFNLGDVLESTGKAAMSRMVGAMLKEKLGFDAQFKANFLEYLPGIAQQGADAISRNFGTGLQSVASQASNTGQVVQGAASSAGLVTFVDDFGTRFTAPADQAGDAATIASGGTPAAQTTTYQAPTAGSVISSGLAAGSIGVGIAGLAGQDQEGQLWIGGGAALGGAIGSIYGPAGTAVGSAIGGLVGWLANEAFNPDPPAFVGQREDLAEAFKGAGVFPSLALSKNPPRTFYDQGAIPGTRVQAPWGWYTPPPSFGTNLRPEMEAIWGLLGLPLDSANSGILFSRATQLGLSEDYQLRELQKVAQANSTIDSALYQLQSTYLRYAQEGKGAEFTQEDYNERLVATIRLLRDDLPEGINIAALAMGNLMQFGQQQVVDIDKLIAEIERVSNVSRVVGGSIRSAAGSAAQSILRGDANAGVTFGNSILDAALGGLGESVISYMDRDGGPLARLRETFANALTPDYPFDVGVDDIRSALGDTGGFFELLNSELARFLPLFEEFSVQIEDATGATAQSYRDRRSQVLGIIDDLEFSRLSPSQQAAELQRRIEKDRGTLSGILADDYIDPATERDQFDRVTGRLTSNAQALFRYGSNFAAGSRQAREIEQAALGALGDVESALSLAVGAIETQEIKVGTMNVSELRITPAAAASLVGGN